MAGLNRASIDRGHFFIMNKIPLVNIKYYFCFLQDYYTSMLGGHLSTWSLYGTFIILNIPSSTLRKGKGNVIVAVRDIKPFETVLIDKPAIVGPFDDTLPMCLECSKPVDVNGYKVS